MIQESCIVVASDSDRDAFMNLVNLVVKMPRADCPATVAAGGSCLFYGYVQTHKATPADSRSQVKIKQEHKCVGRRRFPQVRGFSVPKWERCIQMIHFLNIRGISLKYQQANTLITELDNKICLAALTSLHSLILPG